MKNKRIATIIVGIGIVAYAAWFSWFTIAKAHNYNSGWYDLGIMTQTVWRLAHGYGFTFTNPEAGPGGVHGWLSQRTAIHTDYILGAFVPFSWAGITMEGLLIGQAVILALGGWFVFRIARTLLKNEWLAVILAYGYFLYPPLHFANIFEFHGVTLAITFVLATADAIVHGQKKLFWLWFSLALVTKEQVGLTLGLLTVLLWWWKGKPKLAWTSLGVAWGWSLIQFLVIIPLSRPQLPGSFVYTKFYGSSGDDAGSIVKHFAHPREVWDRLSTRTHLNDVVQLLTPLGFIFPLIGGLALIAIPEMMIYWLSDSPNQQTLFLHYHALAIPYLFLSTIAGLYWIQKFFLQPGTWHRKIVLAVCMAFIILGTAHATQAWSTWPWSPITRWPVVAWKEHQDAQIKTALKLIPANASVAFTQNLGPLLGDRPIAQLLPNGITTSDYIVILERSIDPNIPTNDKRLAERDMLNLLKTWIADQPKAFTTTYAQGRVYVFRRISPPTLAIPKWPDHLLGQ